MEKKKYGCNGYLEYTFSNRISTLSVDLAFKYWICALGCSLISDSILTFSSCFVWNLAIRCFYMYCETSKNIIRWSSEVKLVFLFFQILPVLSPDRFRTFKDHVSVKRRSPEVQQLTRWATGQEKPPHMLVIGKVTIQSYPLLVFLLIEVQYSYSVIKMRNMNFITP